MTRYPGLGALIALTASLVGWALIFGAAFAIYLLA
jgi:hypothetical protein